MVSYIVIMVVGVLVLIAGFFRIATHRLKTQQWGDYTTAITGIIFLVFGIMMMSQGYDNTYN